MGSDLKRSFLYRGRDVEGLSGKGLEGVLWPSYAVFETYDIDSACMPAQTRSAPEREKTCSAAKIWRGLHDGWERKKQAVNLLVRLGMSNLPAVRE